MLSAKTEESDKVIGLSMGADDYVTKPYNTAELMARVKSQLRRYFSLGAANGTTQSQDILKNGGLLLNRNTKELLVDGESVRLTATEYKIMELLMEHPGYVFSAEEIYSQVWQEDAYSVENTVMVHIRRIREKIEMRENTNKLRVWELDTKLKKLTETEKRILLWMLLDLSMVLILCGKLLRKWASEFEWGMWRNIEWGIGIGVTVVGVLGIAAALYLVWKFRKNTGNSKMTAFAGSETGKSGKNSKKQRRGSRR